MDIFFDAVVVAIMTTIVFAMIFLSNIIYSECD